MTLADILVAHGHDMLRLWRQAVRREATERQLWTSPRMAGTKVRA